MEHAKSTASLAVVQGKTPPKPTKGLKGPPSSSDFWRGRMRFIENKAPIRRTGNLSDGGHSDHPTDNASDIRRIVTYPALSKRRKEASIRLLILQIFLPISIVANSMGPTGHFREVYFSVRIRHFVEIRDFRLLTEKESSPQRHRGHRKSHEWESAGGGTISAGQDSPLKIKTN